MSPKLKKILLITAGSLVAALVIIIAFISPITKYLIEKYDEKFTGRQITLDWAYVNPFTGYLYFKNYTVFEQESDSVFFSAEGISVNFSPFKMLSGEYEISSFTLKKPFANIVQNRKEFNFSDLLERFKPAAQDTLKEPVHFSVSDIEITEGEFHYAERSVPVNYYIKNVNFESDGLSWNTDTIPGKFSMMAGPGTGSMKGNFVFNRENMSYRFAAEVDSFDLILINEYLKGIAHYGQVNAFLDADLKASGNLNDKLAINTSGLIQVSDFHFGKDGEEDYFSFSKLTVALDELNPKKKIFHYDSILVEHPVFRYERYDSLDNVQTMFGKKGEKYQKAKADTAAFNLIIAIAGYVNLLAEQFFDSHYKINTLAIQNGEMYFNDYSLREKFSAGFAPFAILADSIDKTRAAVQLSYKTSIKPFGNASLFLTMNPKDYYDFNLSYRMENIPAAMFNPYMVTYSSFPLDRGSMEFNGNWNVQDGKINSENHLLVIDPRVSKRVRKKDAKWLPVPLVMAFVRERGNVIDYEVPVKGNLKDPSFRLKDIFLDLAKNIFIKPPTTPYGLEVKKMEAEIENFHSVKWELRQLELRDPQKQFVKGINEFLEKNPGASISVQPVLYAEKEQEHILFFEAKKKFYLSVNRKKTLAENDSIAVEKMSVKDPSFIRFLNKQVADSLLFTVQEKCNRLLGRNEVLKTYNRMKQARVEHFKSFFGHGTLQRVKIISEENTVPYNGFSCFKISYQGELPEKLRDAYEEMNELNEEEFRRKYKEQRKPAEELVLKAE